MLQAAKLENITTKHEKSEKCIKFESNMLETIARKLKQDIKSAAMQDKPCSQQRNVKKRIGYNVKTKLDFEDEGLSPELADITIRKLTIEKDMLRKKINEQNKIILEIQEGMQALLKDNDLLYISLEKERKEQEEHDKELLRMKIDLDHAMREIKKLKNERPETYLEMDQCNQVLTRMKIDLDHALRENEQLKEERLETHLEMDQCNQVFTRRLKIYSDNCDPVFIDKKVKLNAAAKVHLVREQCVTAQSLGDISSKSQTLQTLQKVISGFQKDDQENSYQYHLNATPMDEENKGIRGNSFEELNVLNSRIFDTDRRISSNQRETENVNRKLSCPVNISCGNPAKEHKEISQTIVHAEKAFFIKSVSMAHSSSNEILNRELKHIEGVNTLYSEFK